MSAAIVWRHKKPDDSHPVEPRYAGNDWVCFKCRELINDAGARVDMSLRGLPPPVLARPVNTGEVTQPGLHVEGS